MNKKLLFVVMAFSAVTLASGPGYHIRPPGLKADGATDLKDDPLNLRCMLSKVDDALIRYYDDRKKYPANLEGIWEYFEDTGCLEDLSEWYSIDYYWRDICYVRDGESYVVAVDHLFHYSHHSHLFATSHSDGEVKVSHIGRAACGWVRNISGRDRGAPVEKRPAAKKQ